MVKLTKVVDLEFELSVMKTYSEIVCVFSKLLEHKSSLEEDLDLLSNCPDMDWKMKMILVYRSEKKKILRS